MTCNYCGNKKCILGTVYIWNNEMAINEPWDHKICVFKFRNEMIFMKPWGYSYWDTDDDLPYFIPNDRYYLHEEIRDMNEEY